MVFSVYVVVVVVVGVGGGGGGGGGVVLVAVLVVVEIRHKASKAGQSMVFHGGNLWQFMASDASGSL